MYGIFKYAFDDYTRNVASVQVLTLIKRSGIHHTHKFSP